jgi:hypothetical protein
LFKGLPSILIAKRYPDVAVTVSDYPDEDLIHTLSQNVADNGVSANCRAVTYGWGSDPAELFPLDALHVDLIDMNAKRFAFSLRWGTQRSTTRSTL